MKKETFIKSLKSISNIIGISKFGSFNTKDWIPNSSDIDITIVMAAKMTFIDIEDVLLELLISYYNYEKEKFIENFCFTKIINLEIFLEQSKSDSSIYI